MSCSLTSLYVTADDFYFYFFFGACNSYTLLQNEWYRFVKRFLISSSGCDAHPTSFSVSKVSKTVSCSVLHCNLAFAAAKCKTWSNLLCSVADQSSCCHGRVPGVCSREIDLLLLVQKHLAGVMSAFTAGCRQAAVSPHWLKKNTQDKY